MKMSWTIAKSSYIIILFFNLSLVSCVIKYNTTTFYNNGFLRAARDYEGSGITSASNDYNNDYYYNNANYNNANYNSANYNNDANKYEQVNLQPATEFEYNNVNTRNGHYGPLPPARYYHHHHNHGGHHHDNFYHDGSMMDTFLHIGAAKLGILGFLKGSVSSFLTKLPFLIIKFVLKFFLIKLGVLFFGVPLLLPLIIPILTIYLPFLSNKFGAGCCGGGGDDDDDDDDDNGNRTSKLRAGETGWGMDGGYENVAGKAMKSLMETEKCYERLACQLGASNSKSEYNKPVLWILGSMLKTGTDVERLRLISFKQAYTKGLDDQICDDNTYQCPISTLMTNYK